MKIASISALIACVMVIINPKVEALRERGQAAVDELHAQSDDDALLDKVCAQKDCRASRLFWHKDLEKAKAAAQQLGRPILSLHLLGNLDEELSCANSRFFRTMLYPDPAIASLLREEFVLHWESVRPVPRVFIDMGDGRFIRQTITGNSAHFLLDGNGKPLDVSPGLHSPKAFREQLERWIALYRIRPDADALRAYHNHRIGELIAMRGIYGVVWEYRDGTRPSAKDAGKLARVKSLPELPILRRLREDESLREVSPETWIQISETEKEKVVFSKEALALMQSKQEITGELLDGLRRNVAEDTIFNEAELHYRIHQWFANGEVQDVATLNERIYAELFLTPEDDPWMGLRPPSVFTAIREETEFPENPDELEAILISH